MKILNIILILLLLYSPAGAWQLIGSGIPASGETCGATPYSQMTSATTAGFNIESSSALIYVGQEIASGQASHDLCKVDLYVRTITGDVSAKTYQLEVWTTSGGNRSVVEATSNTVAGSSISAASWITFTFSSPPSFDATDALVITETAGGTYDGTNHIQIGYVTTDSDSGYSSSAIYTSAGVRTQYTTRDMGYKFYEME